MDIFVNYGAYISLGIIAGTLSGLLGIGGGVIVVPGFIWLFAYQGISDSIIMHVAAGTSLAAMIVTAGCSLYAHYRRGAIFGAILYLMIPFLIIGTTAGAILAHFTHSYILKILFGLLLLAISAKEFFSEAEKTTQPLKNYLGKYGVMAGSSVIGMLSGLLGVGGGTVMIPFLGYCGITLRNAVSISVVCGLIVALIGTVTFILLGAHQPNLPPDSIGYVYLPACIGVSIGSPLFAFLGTMLHHRLKVTVLKKIFSVFLMVVGIRLLI